jgi:hypothetical protein
MSEKPTVRVFFVKGAGVGGGTAATGTGASDVAAWPNIIGVGVIGVTMAGAIGVTMAGAIGVETEPVTRSTAARHPAFAAPL